MSELIDREAAISKIEPWLYSEGRGESELNMLRAVIAELKSLPAAPCWVRCEDKKPKSVINKVIVYCESDERNPCVGFGHYEKFQGVEMWYNLETQEPFSKWNYTVTHWMPLPEPPKEDA